MFVYSIRASTIKFFGIIVLTLAVLVGILVFGSSAEATSAVSTSLSFSGVSTNEDRIAFISQFGIKVDEVGFECAEFSVPEDFDRVISGYNELQRMQGLDISKYKNKRVTRYTYKVKDYEGYDGEVVVNLIIYKKTVIACDVSTTDPNGFVKPLVVIN